MSWIGGSSLTVEEEDGSPSIGGVTKIQISNATLTDDGGGQVSIAVTPGVLSSIEGVSPTSEVAPGTLLAEGGDAWPGATVNTTGANLILAGGIGRRIYTVVAYGHASMADSTVTVTVNGSATVLTEGVDWTAATSNNATATSLAAAIDAVRGVSATASSAVVRIVPDTGTYGLTIAKSADNAGMTATSGTDGAVNIPDAIQLLFDDDVALFRVGDGALQVTDGTPTGYGAIRGYQWLGFDNDGDANASVDIFEGTISFGAGGANAVDTEIRYVQTRTLQLIGSGASTDKGNLWLGGLRGFATGGSVNMFEFINTGINLRATLPINWSSGENSDGPFDLGAVRAGGNVLKITNGSTGYGALSLDTNAGVYADTVTLSDAAKTAVLDIAIADGEFICGGAPPTS